MNSPLDRAAEELPASSTELRRLVGDVCGELSWNPDYLMSVPRAPS